MKHMHKFDTIRSFQRPDEDKIMLGECSICGTVVKLDDMFTVVAETVVEVEKVDAR